MEILKCPSCKSGNVELIRIDRKDEGMKCKDCGALVRWYSPIEAQFEIKEKSNNVRPIPCVRDEHGEIKEQSVKQLIGKVNEELDELKEAIILYGNDKKSIFIYPQEVLKREQERIAEEAADTITSITTLLEALGIGEGMRGEAQLRVNKKNRERGRL